MKDFPIQVGTEKYSGLSLKWIRWWRNHGKPIPLNTWDGIASFEIDATQGADTANSAKITVLSTGDELQIFSVNMLC